MASFSHRTEEQLAELVCASVDPRAVQPPLEVLIGGLGMGFTLRSALDCLPPEANVVVSETVAAVIDWNLGPLSHLTGDCVQDPRVTILNADVYELVGSAEDRWDSIMLDVDNGPQSLSIQSNARLYGLEGLRLLHTALRAGGTVGVWAPSPYPPLADRLATAGFKVRMEVLEIAEAEGEESHVVYLARKPSD